MKTEHTETKPAHTPGPWGVGKRNRIMAGNAILIGEDEITAPCWVNVRDAIEEQNANARLIASAPDLLEACQSIWKMIEDGTLVRDVSKDSNPDWSKMLLEFTMTLNKVNAAIAKATGGQP